MSNLGIEATPMTVAEWVPIATPRVELLHGFEYDLRGQATTALHARVAFRVAAALDRAVRDAGLPCVVRTEGPLVEIDENTAHIPDVSVECNRQLGDTSDTHVTPCIVVEVLSPATRSYDMTTKVTNYIQRLDYVRDYLVVDTDARSMIHYTKGKAGSVDMCFAHTDIVLCSFPLTLSLADIFETRL